MKCHSGLSSMQMILIVLVIAGGLFGWYWYSHRPMQSAKTEGQQEKVIIALLGAPGSGKGTVARRAVKDFGFITLSTGDLVRENIAKGTALGDQVKVYSQAGKLVPDDIIFGMAKEWLLAKAPEGKTIVLDGFPRTATQAAMLTDFIKSDLPGYSLRLIELNVPQEELIQRIANRLTCEQCQATFQKGDFEHPATAVCPRCGGKLIQRADDREEVVRARFADYNQANNPMMDYFRTSGMPIDIISGSGKKADEVFAEFTALIKK